MDINKENWEKFHKELAEFRGFNEKEWNELNPGLRTLIGLRTHIEGKGSALFKCIIEALTDHEKRLKVQSKQLAKKEDKIDVNNIKEVKRLNEY